MLGKIVELSIQFRVVVVALLALLLAAGGFAASTLPIDAVPDVSTVQVSVLTESPGLSPIEVERTVTTPIEMALNGMPNLADMRSVSRTGLSVVTAIFKDKTDIWFARQVAIERLRTVEDILPAAASKPELSPVSGGLGEIFQFVVRSEHHSPTQLRTILDWDIVPRLRGVPGVIEVNTMGGDLKQYQVVIDRGRLHSHNVTLEDVAQAVQRANTNVGGGYIERSSESLSIRGVGVLRNEDEIANVVVQMSEAGSPILVKHIATVRVGAALRYGVITRDAEGEAVTGIVMMLIGANSRDVVHTVKDRLNLIQQELPAGVVITPIYDRSEFISRTLTTVTKNLIEGALIVTVVLALILGSIRGALVVVLGIPASMSVALFGMHLFDVTGDLMSLGAIDFGFLVDGAIVILEAAVAALAGKSFSKRIHKVRAYQQSVAGVARAVAFSVAIIMLVYLPLLSLEGIEGKMFKPMAVTMACALFGSLVYALVFFPALLFLFVPPPAHHGPKWMDKVTALYERVLPSVVRIRWTLLTVTGAALVLSMFLFARAGADFVPRIEEGDMIVTIRRAPSINLTQAKELDLQAEKIVRTFPEVITVLGMTGRAEVAVDPVGNDKTDLFLHLKPRPQWTTAHDLDSLSEKIKRAVENGVAGTFASISQPIEDRTNELISGSRADIQIQLYGEELTELKRIGGNVGEIVRGIPGTGDVRVESVLGLPTLTVVPDRTRLARYGVRVQDALSVLQAARVGMPLGVIYEGQRRFDLRLIAPPRAATAEALGELFVQASGDTTVPLSELATIDESEGPTQVRHQVMKRTTRVEVNLRGRDLVSWVNEARERIGKEVSLPRGYAISWGGQFENFERAKKRLAMVVPISLGIIFGMLLWMFSNVRAAVAVFAAVPFAIIGGIIGLILRGLPFSIPAAVGFIALAGVAVLNGVVMTSNVKSRFEAGASLDDAVTSGAVHTMRAVITTGAVAALGFLPMAIADSAGAEVQRPLATVVICGILLSTLLTMFLLPGILRIALRGPDPEDLATIRPPKQLTLRPGAPDVPTFE